MTKFEKEIVRKLFLCQLASHSGKCQYYDFDYHSIDKKLFALKGGYKKKLNLLVSILKSISNSSNRTINFWCEQTPDQNGYSSVIVYFDLKLDGKRWQVSQHTPMSLAEPLYPFVNKGRKTRWSKIKNEEFFNAFKEVIM